MKTASRGYSCPYCGGELRPAARYCGRCGVSIARWDLTWSIRRAIGGAVAGGAGWVASLTFIRLAFPSTDLALPQPAFSLAAGSFIGLAGGLMEHSARSLRRGLLVGAAGGFLIALLTRGLAGAFGAAPESLFWLDVFFWAVFGLCLGFFCGRLPAWEAAGGLVSGGLAGALAWHFALTMAAQYPEAGWARMRAVEFLTGAILGGLIWGGVSLAGRLGLRRWTLFLVP